MFPEDRAPVAEIYHIENDVLNAKLRQCRPSALQNLSVWGNPDGSSAMHWTVQSDLDSLE